MRNRLLAVVALSGCCMLGVANTARAQSSNLVQDRPSATLLLPYFEVDLVNPAGITTQFSINNSSATAVLVHVIVWSDLSVPVLAFNVYLTGYDVQRVDMRNILNGILPQTASAGQDPADTISPRGTLSQDINFASCNGILPPPKTLPAIYVTHLHDSLTGKGSPVFFGGNCAGVAYTGTLANIARGYVTMDTVNNCTLRVPTDPGYFAPGGSGDVTNQNVLWGDYYFIQASAKIGRGDTLVHINADAVNPATSTPGRYTFYGRYDNFSAADNREPLSTTYAARYMDVGAPFPQGTSFVVWRDPKVAQQPFTCPAIMGVRPAWYPLGQEGLLAFDEQEHPQFPTTEPVWPPLPPVTLVPFPSATQKVKINSAAFPVSFNQGWIYLDLNTTVTAAPAVPPVDPAAAQAFVTVVHDDTGIYSVGYRAVALDSAEAALHFVP